jgi:hypothetical protein
MTEAPLTALVRQSDLMPTFELKPGLIRLKRPNK